LQAFYARFINLYADLDIQGKTYFYCRTFPYSWTM